MGSSSQYSTSFWMNTKMTEAPLHKELCKEKKWQCVRAVVGKASSGHKKGGFYSENSHSLEPLVMAVPITGKFPRCN